MDEAYRGVSTYLVALPELDTAVPTTSDHLEIGLDGWAHPWGSTYMSRTELHKDVDGDRYSVNLNLDPPAQGGEALDVKIRSHHFIAPVGGLVNETTLSSAYGPVIDLDGDGAMTTTDVSTTYKLLPTRLTLTFKTAAGMETRSMFLMLTNE